MWLVDEGLKCWKRLSLFEGLTIGPSNFKGHSMDSLTELARASLRDSGNLGAATINWIHIGSCIVNKSFLTRGQAEILFYKSWFPQRYLG